MDLVNLNLKRRINIWTLAAVFAVQIFFFFGGGRYIALPPCKLLVFPLLTRLETLNCYDIIILTAGMFFADHVQTNSCNQLFQLQTSRRLQQSWRSAKNGERPLYLNCSPSN